MTAFSQKAEKDFWYELILALRTCLKEDAFLKDCLNDRIYLCPPASTPTPAITLTPIAEHDCSHMSSHETDISTEIHIWDRHNSNEDIFRLRAIMSQIRVMLHMHPIRLPHHSVILSHITGQNGPILNEDNFSLHGSVTWRCLIGLSAPQVAPQIAQTTVS